MTINLDKIGDSSVEKPKDFPVIHDANIDKTETKFTALDASISNISSTLLQTQSDIDTLNTRVDAISGTDLSSLDNRISATESQIVEISANVALNVDNIVTLSLQIASISAASLSGSDATNITYNNNPSYATVSDALDALLYVSPVISGLTNDVGSIEVGTSVSSVGLSWSYNKTMVTASLNQSIGSISAVLNSYIHSTTINPSVATTTTYTLTANDGTNSTNASTSVSHKFKRYWGTNSNSTLNDAQILALANNELGTSRAKSFTINGSGEYIYICYPASWGAATFTVNGLLSTAWTLSTQSHINASGHTESYRVYRTNTVQNGTGISIVVS